MTATAPPVARPLGRAGMTTASPQGMAMSSPAASRGTVLVLGASSMIARATAAALARRGFDLVLASRDLDDVRPVASDLRIRFGVIAACLPFDARDIAGQRTLIANAIEIAGGGLAGVVFAAGLLGDQARATRDPEHAAEIVAVNLVGAITVLTHAANHLESRGAGFIAAVGSVAGDRGRQSNYVYGCAKAGLAVYLDGLRHRLARSGVAVTTIKPGFVDTQMTFGLPGMFAVASPASAGEAIANAIERRRSVAYVPGFWRLIMLVIRLLPERIFHRTRL